MKNSLLTLFVAALLMCSSVYATDLQEIQKILAGNAEAGDQFGRSISISGDYAIVGAMGEDSSGTDAGAAYIFNKNLGGSDNWGQATKLTANDAEAGDWFGVNVSILGNYASVGAVWDDAGGSGAGAAYMFQLYTSIPTLPEWGMIALGLLFAGIGGWFVLRRFG